MKGHRTLITCVLIASAFLAQAQTITTEGTDFWFSYLNNWLQDPGNPIINELYISSADTTEGTIDIPLANGFETIQFEVVPGQATRIGLPPNLTMAQGSETIENKGVHLSSKKRVSVYAMNKRQYSADVTVLIPTPSLGREYRVMSHWENGNRNNGDNSQSEFMVVAIADQTEIEITPSVRTMQNKAAGQPFTIILDQGQVYQVQANADLTGSLIRSVGSSGCDNFAVFGGNRYTKVGECDHPDGHDHLYSQLYPVNTWGKEFTMVPFRSRSGGDVIKVLAHLDSTEVVFGLRDTVKLNAGEFHQTLIDRTTAISSDQPVSIGQFSRSQACDNTTSDPFLITISPDEQLLKSVTFNAPVIATLDEYYLNVVTPSKNFQNIRLDGVPIGSQLDPVPNNNDMYYGRIPIQQGNHTLQSAEGFIAYVYGYGNNESFGYSTGASLENLNVEVAVQDINGIAVPADSICKGSEVYFRAEADSIFTTFIWEFGDGSEIVSDNPGPVMHSYDQDGTYEVLLTVRTEDGVCSEGTQEFSRKNLTVLTPAASVLGPRSVCPGTENVAYFATSEWDNTYHWFVTGGNIDTVLTGDSVLIDWGPSNPDAYLGVIPTSSIGCVGDTVLKSVSIGLQLDPEAPFGPDTLCSSSLSDTPYQTFEVATSRYTWSLEFGDLKSGQGSNEVSVDWSGYGYGKIWFREESVLDNVCAGVSDTLRVFIERSPSPDLVISAADTIDILQQLSISLATDTIYRLMTYDFGDGTQSDTTHFSNLLFHQFSCFGDYALQVSVMDTLGFCRAGTSNIKPVHVRKPGMEIINVTHHETDTALIVNWKSTGMDAYPNPFVLTRSQIEPEFGTERHEISEDLSYTDMGVTPSASLYDYNISIEPDPDCIIGASPHRNVRLLSSPVNNTEASLMWNEYTGWSGGVEKYEVWRSIDDNEWTMVTETVANSLNITNENKGFSHCFRIRAVESEGNKSQSLSNLTCVDFFPEIVTYNVISPNGDGMNESFVIERIELYPNSELVISNRYGKELLNARGYGNTFDGKINGRELPAGVYYWTLRLNEPRAPEQVLKGFLHIMR